MAVRAGMAETYANLQKELAPLGVVPPNEFANTWGKAYNAISGMGGDTQEVASQINGAYSVLMGMMMPVAPLRAGQTPLPREMIYEANGGKCPNGYRVNKETGKCEMVDASKVSPAQFERINRKLGSGSGSGDKVEVDVNPKDPPQGYFLSSTPRANGEPRQKCPSGFKMDPAYFPDMVCVRSGKPTDSEYWAGFKKVISPRAVAPGARPVFRPPTPFARMPMRTPFTYPSKTPFGTPTKTNGDARRVCPDGYTRDPKKSGPCVENGKPKNPMQWGYDPDVKIPEPLTGAAAVYRALWNSLAWNPLA